MRRLLLFLVIFLLAGAGLFLWLRPDRGEAALGPPVALCPGPDLYGYTCADGTAFAYIDATRDSGLHEDDGAVRLSLPFPFTFYGSTYESVWAGSNGTLHFGRQNPRFNNRCLDDGPVANMGEMIAVFWDDLDLSFSGALEVETVGTAPDRIFVVEWQEVPLFMQPEEGSVTFSVQLHEGSNDIVLHYPDTTTGSTPRGSGATVGVQSEARGLSLQYACNQAVLGDATALHILHPLEPNDAIAEDAELAQRAGEPLPGPLLKGPPALLAEGIRDRGTAALPALRRHWLGQTRPLLFAWHQADLDGDGVEEVIGLWSGPASRPETAQVAVLSLAESTLPGRARAVTPRFTARLSSRQITFSGPEVLAVEDLTGDGLPDLLLQNGDGTRLATITFAGTGPELRYLPGVCRGMLALRDVDGDGTVDLLRGECELAGPKSIYTWQGGRFVPLTP